MNLKPSAHALTLMFCLGPMLSLATENLLTINNAWVRATVPAQSSSGAFLDITSARSARLIKAETSVAKTVEIHSMSVAEGVMRMRELKELALPAGKKVSFSPGGYHLMLVDLSRPLRAGERITLKLTTLDANNIQQVTSALATVK